MIQIIAVHMTGTEHLQHIEQFRWVETSQPGGPARTAPKDTSRAEMVSFVRANPEQTFAMSARDKTYALVKVVEAQPAYVRTLPDSTTRDNLLSLPRF